MNRTPLKLKRDTLSALSTIDRTAPATHKNSSLQLSSIVPAFSSTDGRAFQKLEYGSLKPIIFESEKVNTNEIDKQMQRIMKEQKILSQRNRALAKGSHFYNLKPLQSKIAIGQLSPIPQKVRQIYDQMAQSSPQTIQFKQGVLANASMYYFAIGGKVLFYDIGGAIKYGGQLQHYYSHQIQLPQTVYEIKQINWKHPIFKEFKNRNIIVISSPWRLSFAALEVQSFQPGLERCSRWMRVTLLNTCLQLSSQIAYHMVESENCIYYLDESGRVNRISIEGNDWITNLIGNPTSKYRLSQASKPTGISSKSLYLSSKASFLERIRHYSKVIYSQAASFYSPKIKNYDLVIDHKRKLLFSLINSNFTAVDELSISSYKMLACWDISGKQINKRYQISQLELYDLHVQPIANYNSYSNYRIAKIEPIDPSFNIECNLMVVLHCGIRLYFNIQSNKCQMAHYHLPPLIQSRQIIDKKHEAKQFHRPVEMTHCYFFGSTAIFNLKEENDNHTIFISKLDQRKQCEDGLQLLWGTNMNKGAAGNVPLQNYINKINICFNSPKKIHLLKAIFPNTIYSPIPYSNQLARNLFYFSDVFVHSTDQQIQYFTVVRSVDKMFNTVLSEVKDEHVLCKIFEDYSLLDIQFLLIQIYCDKQGLYLKDLNLMDCMTYFQKKCLNSGGIDFNRFQNEFEQSNNKSTIKHEYKRDIYPTFVGREVITQQLQNRILQLLLKLTTKRQCQTYKPAQIYQSICTSILTYIARLTKFLWKKSLNELKKNISLIVPMIQPLNRILQYFSSPQIASKLNNQQQKQTKLMKSTMFERARMKNQVKIVENKQHPLKMTSKYINKIIQLITLCQRVDLKFEKTFSQGLSLQAQEYEEYIFRFLISQYQDPIQSFYIYKKLFPYFIGQNLEKAIKIYLQAKSKKKADILTILKFHTKVPNYLLAHYQQSSLLYPQQVRQIRNSSVDCKTQRQLISCSSDKDSMEYYLKQLKQPHKSFSERNILIVALSSMLNHYLIKNEQRQDGFYKEKKGELQQIQKKVSFQELVIEEYEKRSDNAKNQIVNGLKNTLYDEQMLCQFQSILNNYKIGFIYLILFDSIDNPEVYLKAEKCLYNMIVVAIKDQQQQQQRNGLITKAKNYIKSKFKNETKNKWRSLEQNLACIVSQTTQYIQIDKLIQMLTKTIIKIYSTSDDFFQSHISTIINIFFQYKNKHAIRQQATKLNLPVVSLILFKVGAEPSEMYRYYESWLRVYGQSNMKITNQDKHMVLYNWINLYCLSLQIQPRWQFFVFNLINLKDNFSKSFPSDQHLVEQLESLGQTFAQINNMGELYADALKNDR